MKGNKIPKFNSLEEERQYWEERAGIDDGEIGIGKPGDLERQVELCIAIWGDGASVDHLASSIIQTFVAWGNEPCPHCGRKAPHGDTEHRVQRKRYKRECDQCWAELKEVKLAEK